MNLFNPTVWATDGKKSLFVCSPTPGDMNLYNQFHKNEITIGINASTCYLWLGNMWNKNFFGEKSIRTFYYSSNCRNILPQARFKEFWACNFMGL